MVSNEFIDCGPRVVHEDWKGPYVIYSGAIIRSELLYNFVGHKIHVTASLLGDGWELSEWCDPIRRHPGGWRTRIGADIAWVDSEGPNHERKTIV